MNVRGNFLHFFTLSKVYNKHYYIRDRISNIIYPIDYHLHKTEEMSNITDLSIPIPWIKHENNLDTKHESY